jgi:hypothetical protein
MKVALDQHLASLPTLPRKALEKLWQEQFDRPLGRGLRRENVVRILAYRLQEKAYGGLKTSVAKQLRALLENDNNSRKSVNALTLRPKPGTRIVREWKEKLHEILVLPDSYEYEGNIYRSLSEIARLITGTRWSGPAFFGTKRRAQKVAAE